MGLLGSLANPSMGDTCTGTFGMLVGSPTIAKVAKLDEVKTQAIFLRNKLFMTQKDLDQLELIFSDADLVDVDCSLWDTAIVLFVLADHVPARVPGQTSLLAVHFKGVRKLEWTFAHHDFTKFPLTSDPHQHLNWNIYSVKISRSKQLYRVRLGGVGTVPSNENQLHRTRYSPDKPVRLC